MIKNVLKASLALFATSIFISCDDKSDDNSTEGTEVVTSQLSKEMKKVRDYVPKNAVIAHRGTTFWAPEETEAAFRWAREIGADYLEADLQVSKDGVILALHDGKLNRTTNIEEVFGEELPKGRKQYYIDLGYSETEANQKVEADKASFKPYFTSFYTYAELLQLDAGTWFNKAKAAQARKGFTTEKQYVSTLEDLIAFSRGKRIKRDSTGNRIFKIIGKTGKTISGISGISDKVHYEFEYINDDQDTGNRPGIYLEFKEPEVNPKDVELMVYNELARLNMNIITNPELENTPFYKNRKVNIGNTNGKVILQTFSIKSLTSVEKIFKGKVPMCFLLWKGEGEGYMANDNLETYKKFINIGIQHKAHIAGPSIGGEPNNYPDINQPWQADLIRKSGMLNHPYSFDTKEQMTKYFEGNKANNEFKAPYVDGMFTNRSEMTLQYFIEKGVRKGVSQEIADAEQLLERLGYSK